MKTATRIGAVAVVLLLVVLGGRRAGWFGAKSADESAPAPERSSEKPAKPASHAAGALRSRVVREATVLHEDDPTGSLRLEGQVIDADEQPVPGAAVAIDTNPPRTVTTEGDGSFAIDGLIGRGYALEAHSDDAYAGPVYLRLSPDSEPVILRVRPVGALQVTVRDAATQEPVDGAEVQVRAWLTWNARTDATGVAELHGVGLGQNTLRVCAAGYACSTRRVLRSEKPEALQREVVLLDRGGRVSGRVLDEEGNPVRDARVLAIPTSEPFPVFDPRLDSVSTDRKGAWQIHALAAGTYRFTASHASFAPSTTAPIPIDGVAPRAGIDFTLRPGATFSGTVVTGAGEPVAGADVRLVARGNLIWRTARQAYTDDSGAFRIGGLPRYHAEAIASNASSASPIVPVDLVASDHAEATLRLVVRGTISGKVVDSSGEPLPEAQVFAEPEWTGAVGERRAWGVRGVQFRVADAAGSFQFGGLPAGDYRLRAARPGAPEAAVWLAPGTVVSVGDANVELTVPDDGSVEGRVLYDDGSAPPAFTVAIGATSPVAFASEDGAFSMAAPGGKHNLVVTGPTFARAIVEAEISGSGPTDVGTITVKKGRSVSGRVLDASGAPVAGAQVAAGMLLSGDGTKLYIEDESINARSTETDADGRYVLTGFGPGRITMVAGRAGVGRSQSLTLPPGNASAEVDLVLQPTGSLEGTVTRDGQPVAETIIIANPIGATASNFFVATGADGSYALDALTAGEYQVYPMIGGGGAKPKDMFIRPARVVAGERSRLDIAITTGNAALEISVTTEDGAPVQAAQVFLVGLGLDDATLAGLRDGSWLGWAQGKGAEEAPIPLYLRMALGAPARVEGLVPGPHTVCAVPLPMNPNNPLAAMKLREMMDELPYKCERTTVTPAPAVQKTTVVVPEEWTHMPKSE